MKKWMQTGKKALSVIMAVLMVMSAWVWVAPEKASAAAGKYDVQIKWYVGDDDMDSNGGSISLWTKGNNGTDSDSSATKHSEISFANGDTSGKNQWSDTSMIWTNVGFPYKFTMSLADTFFGRALSADVYVYVRKNGTTTWSEAVGSFYINDWGDNTTHDGVFTITNAPVATTFNWSNTPEGMTCPKSGSISQTVAVTANDQFGVQMYDPVWSVKGSSCGTTGISVSTGSNKAASTSISLTNGANNTTTTDTQTGTVTATWGSASNSKTFTITDSYYTATFDYQTQNADNNTSSTKTETRNGYHGDSITAPNPLQYYDHDFLKTFSAWTPTYNSTITKDVTYTAQYNSTFVGADYSAVNEAIAAADAIKANYGTDYELKYTLASRLALDTAINAVVTGLGRTQQTTVDSYAQAINDAIASLDENTFSVIFLDKNGAILLYEKDAKYKSTVQAPAFPEDQKSYHDAENHYTYNGWDTDEYTSVIDDLVIAPAYTAEPHDWKIENVASTCVQAGTQKYTCKVCGYVKYDGGDELGDHVWDTEFTTDLEPTCTLAGSKSIHCTLCDAQKDITVVPALDHQWGSQSIAVEATCGKVGIMAKVCDDCLFCEHTIIPALEHDYKKTTVAPTCTAKGYDEYVCQRENCGHSYRDNYTDVIAHTYGAWETVSEAHCGVAGVKKQTCTECGYVNLGSIDALTHDALDSLEWNVVVEDTCDYAGYRTKTCSKCNNVIAAENFDIIKGHDIKTETTPATCTTAGQIVETCQRENCGYIKTTVIQPLTHNWDSGKTTAATCTSGGYITYTCQRDNCGEKRVEIINGSSALLHDFTGTETIVTAATCEADGEKTVKCTRCDVTTTVIIPKLGHSYGDWVKTDATNDKDGSWYHKCSTCGKEETLVIPNGGHNLVEDTAQYVAPKCNTKGQRVYKCTAHENCSVTVTVELYYAQHTIAQKTTDATCTTTGSVMAYCSVCNVEFNSVEIPQKAHNYTALNAVAPTCTTSGYTPYECSCGDTYNAYDDTKPATGHDFDETVATNVTTIPATCTADGSKTVKCSKCDAIKEEVLPKTGHNFVENASKATSATCTALATKTFECSCGASYVEHVGTLAAHKFDTLVKTVPATNDSLGYEERKCACGLVEITILEATGTHVFNEKITGECIAPTCTENGTYVYKCTAHTDCGAKSSVLVPRLGHTVTAVYKAPSCVAEGSSDAYCTTCNTTINSTVIPAKGHAYNTVTVTTEAGCETTGVRTYTCECGETKTEVIPAKGHDLSTTVTDATCGTAGKVIIDCANCNDPAVEKTIELAAKGHIWNDTPESTVDAKCETDGSETYKCQNCEETNVVVLPKLGHEWGNWSVTKASTNTEKGEMTRTCSRGCTETVEIPVGGHELVVDNDKSTPASCSEEGTTVYKCKNHDNCGITVTVSEPKTQHTVAQREIEATCTKKGSVEAYCSVCGELLSTKEIPVKAHNYVALNAVEPTCTTSGYTPYRCSCGDTYNVYDEAKPATGHDFDENVATNVTTIPATCTADGSKTVKCSKCDAIKEEVLPKTGHNFVKGTVTAADCTTAGTEVYTCACGDTYTKFVEAAKGHTYGSWEVVTAATADKSGVQKRTCACGDVEYSLLAPIGNHKFTEEITTPATCTTEGLKTFTCSVHKDCTANYTEKIPATGHTQKIVYTAPSCIADGSSKVVCEICQAEILSEIVQATGCHDFSGEGVKADATCTEEGTMTYICKTDGCTATKVEKIPAKGHAFKTTVTLATCTSKGSAVTECTVCKADSAKTIVEIPMLAHAWDNGKITTEANCTTEGEITYTCDCGATEKKPVPAKGHTWSDWSVTPSTNADKGSVTRTCSICKDVETVDIPAGGHELVVDNDKSTPASCSKEGTTVYKCKNHDNCGITLSVTTDKLQHELEKTETLATCTTDGSVVTKCKKCETATYTTVIPATGHDYSAVITKAASCTEEGIRTYTCAHDATHTYTEPIAKLQHNYVAGTSVPATCTSSGYTPYKCENCKSGYVILTDDATGHEIVEGSSTATCTEGGKMTLTCKNCTAYSETVDVPALGHNYEKKSSTTATCKAAATETYKCSRCTSAYTVSVGDKTTEHKWGALTTVDATNTSLGYTTRTCEECGQVEFNIIPATGEHKFDVETTNKLDPTCTDDGYVVYACSTHKGDDACSLTSKVIIPATGHKEKLDYKAATCETAGYSKVICETCKSTIGEEVTISALGHLFDGEGVYEAATCKTAGSMTYTCSRQDCNATHITTIAVNPDAHKTETNTVDATCQSEGSVITSCTLCDKELIKTPLPKLQHEWGEWTVIPAANGTPGSATRTCANGCTETVEIPAGGHRFGDTPVSTTPATCSATGTETYKCAAHTDCGIEITVITAKTAHTPKYEIVDATCTNEGSIKTVCEKCDATLVEAITIGKLQHVFEQQGESVDATCTSSGYTVFKCKNCTETYKQIGENAIGHELVITSDSSSCTVEGKVTVTCSKCDLEQTSKVPALGHDYVEDTSAATEATCAQAATKTYKCSRCSASYTVSVGDKLTEESAHNWSGWTTVKDATDISIGYKTRECSVCGKLEVVTIEANGEHKFADGEVVEGGASKAATCTENGYETRRCSVHENCTETEIVTIPATGHSEETIEATDATCTAPGSTVGTKCSKCDTVLDAPVEIPALGHAWGNEKVTPATCQTAGKIEYTCTRVNCNESHTVEIAVDEDAHSLVTDVEQATCEAPGKVTVSCSNACGYNKETEIPAKGHTWDDGTVTKNASCESTGIKTHTCVNCGESSDEIIPALGHIYEAGEKVSATCTTSGYTVYTCKNDANHTYNVYDSDATATGHDWTEWTIVEKATETTDGSKERTCKVDGCDGKETEVIPAMKHNMVLADEKASTCKDAGYKVYKCETEHDGVICNYTLRVDLPLVAHTLVTTVTEATCQAEGSVVTACGCGYKLEEKTLAVKPHTIAYSTHYPNCEDGGYVKAYCTNTGCTYNEIIGTSDALGHDFTIDVSIDKSATCLEEGSKTVKCSRCEETTTVTIPAKGHDYKPGEEVKATCTESGYIPYTCACGDSYNKLTSEPTSHNWVVDNKSCVEPTCETEGKTVYRCSCGAEKETVISKHGHSWVWTLTKNPTAKDDGILTGECVRCHDTQTFTIPAIGGGSVTCVVTFVVDGKVVATQNVNYGGSATAPEISKASDANNHYSLVWDNDFTNVTSDLTVTAQFVASAHSFGGWETEIEATCSKAGSMKRVCSECGYAETKITETTDHDYSIIIKTVDATCTENGYIEKECKDCHKKTTEVLRRLGHNLTYHEGYAATCTEDGERAHYSCSRCGNLFEDAQGRIVITDVVIGKRYHSLVIIEGKDATCTVDGSTDYVRCTVCGYTENSTTIPAYGHTDVNNDKCCDRCDSAYLEGGEIVCTCSCHKPGIINEIIYKIIRFFWKLFGSNKSCECGVLHY